MEFGGYQRPQDAAFRLMMEWEDVAPDLPKETQGEVAAVLGILDGLGHGVHETGDPNLLELLLTIHRQTDGSQRELLQSFLRRACLAELHRESCNTRLVYSKV